MSEPGLVLGGPQVSDGGVHISSERGRCRNLISVLCTHLALPPSPPITIFFLKTRSCVAQIDFELAT